MEVEWKSYAEDAREIIESFVFGINSYIERIQDNLPIEFQIMGFEPEPWTPEVCLTRLAGYDVSRGLGHEVVRALLTKHLGPEETARLLPTEPEIPIEIPDGLDLDDIALRILSGHTSVSKPLTSGADAGSNNWVINGTKPATGHPILANDPHRTIALPSLRYMVHLVAPGWNVIGAGEPALLGVALGHNERVAFGFTIFWADNQDLYVEETKPDDPTVYRYKDEWLPMETEPDLFYVKGQAEPLEIPLRYTRHGPVIYEATALQRAYALRWTGSEAGAAAYLASLSLDRASNWTSFRAALTRWKQPVENLVYADVDGHIGHQAAGAVPRRLNWSGIVPVPGYTGAFEWDGLLSLNELPHVFNPVTGYIATANHCVLTPDDPPHIGYDWSPDFRYRRIDEILREDHRFTVDDFKRLHEDVVSLPARELIDLFRRFHFDTDPLLSASTMLFAWDGALTPASPAAALYEMWVYKLVEDVIRPIVPDSLWDVYKGYYGVDVLLNLLKYPDTRFGVNPEDGRDRTLKRVLILAIRDLSDRYGLDMTQWRWGQMHTVTFAHPLNGRVNDMRFTRGPYPRGGDSHTVNHTSEPLQTDWAQTSGATYRQILDVGDWDRSVAINAPGQSGQPGSPRYDDLIPLWATGSYHPLLYTHEAIEAETVHRMTFEPQFAVESYGG
jgi:penicillin amidase